MCSHFLQANGKLKHLGLSREKVKKKKKKYLSLTVRASEQEKALAWHVSDALAHHDEIYWGKEVEGVDKWQESVRV